MNERKSEKLKAFDEGHRIGFLSGMLLMVVIDILVVIIYGFFKVFK